MLSDLQLIEQARKGDSEAFRQLVNRYESQVASTVVGMMGNGPEAEDVGQEVFIRFYKALHQFKGEAALGTYLTRIAINLSLNSIKKRKRKNLLRFFSQDNQRPELQIPDHGLSQEQRETQELVQQALQCLDPDFRTVMVLRMIEGYSTKETAELLGVPLGTVLSRLARAQKKLKNILAPVMQ